MFHQKILPGTIALTEKVENREFFPQLAKQVPYSEQNVLIYFERHCNLYQLHAHT